MDFREWAALDSYIVRVYRRGVDAGRRRIAGIVEVPVRNTRVAFHSFAELETILGSHEPPRRRKKQATRSERPR
jgi:hypothetical protein